MSWCEFNRAPLILTTGRWRNKDFSSANIPWLGVDMCGVVESVSEDVKDMKVGDEVWGYTGCGNTNNGPTRGTFASHCVVQKELLSPRPNNWTVDQCASTGLGLMTAAYCLFEHLGVPLPSQAKAQRATGPFILIWGGATSVGMKAIQLAVLAGYKVIATASSKNIQTLKNLGAIEVFDYKSPNVVKDIVKYTSEDLHLALDCVGSETATKAVQTLGAGPGRLATIAGAPEKGKVPQNVRHFEVLVAVLQDKPDGAALIQKYLKELNPLLSQKKIQPMDVRVMPGGLKNIPSGLKELSAGKTSCEKLVYHITDGNQMEDPNVFHSGKRIGA